MVGWSRYRMVASMPAMKVGAMIEPRLPGAAEFAVAAEGIGVTSLWVPEVWGYDALTGLAYLAAKTSSVQARNLCRATGFAQSGVAGDVGAEPAGAVGGAIHLGRRHVGATGHGGLARRPLSQAGADHPGDHRDHPHGQPRRAPRACRGDLSVAAAGQSRLSAQAAGASRRSCPGLRGGDGSAEPAS